MKNRPNCGNINLRKKLWNQIEHDRIISSIVLNYLNIEVIGTASLKIHYLSLEYRRPAGQFKLFMWNKCYIRHKYTDS